MLSDFHARMEQVLTDKHHYLIEKTEHRFLIRDSLFDLNKEYIYLADLTEKLMIYDPRLFAYKKIDQDEFVVYSILYNVSIPSPLQHFHTEIKMMENANSLEFDINTVNRMGFSIASISGLKPNERQNMMIIKDVFREEMINSKEFRLPLITGTFKLYDRFTEE